MLNVLAYSLRPFRPVVRVRKLQNLYGIITSADLLDEPVHGADTPLAISITPVADMVLLY